MVAHRLGAGPNVGVDRARRRVGVERLAYVGGLGLDGYTHRVGPVPIIEGGPLPHAHLWAVVNEEALAHGLGLLPPLGMT